MKSKPNGSHGTARSSTSIPIASSVYDFMAWLQGSALGHAMRESGVWTYGIVNLIHILGVASLFGAVLVLDLRLMGLWRRVALAHISEATVPVATTGFVI